MEEFWPRYESGFIKAESPDWQNEPAGIGIEITSAILSTDGISDSIREDLHGKSLKQAIDENNRALQCKNHIICFKILSGGIVTYRINDGLIEICKSIDGSTIEISMDDPLLSQTIYVTASSGFVNSDSYEKMAYMVLLKKIKKLSKWSDKFKTKVLYIDLLINFIDNPDEFCQNMININKNQFDEIIVDMGNKMIFISNDYFETIDLQIN